MQGQGKVSKIQNLKTAGVNMQREIKQSGIYRTEILQISISTDKKKKVKYTELKYARCE